MYCPRCGEKQLPSEIRFCSRCGFQLVAVSRLLQTGGIADIQPKETLPLIQRPELRKGAKRVFLCSCLLAVSFPIMGVIDPFFPLASPFIIGVAFITFLLFGLGFFIWLILAIWAVVSYNNGKSDKRYEKLVNAIKMKSKEI